MKPLFIRLLPLLIFPILFSACNIPFLNQKAGVQITSTPQATVTLDGQSLGQTPIIRNDIKSGTHTIKITPSDSLILPWEGQLTINPGVTTVLDRQLSSDPTQSTGHSLILEKLSDSKSVEVNIITTQDNVSVAIDGTPSGFTPLKSTSVTPGAHVFLLTSPGFQDKIIKANVQVGHRLTVNAQLASQTLITPTPTPDLSPSPSATPSSTPSPTKTKTATSSADVITPLPKTATSAAVSKPYVEILTTPTGFLRVRDAASASATEIAKVNPGDKFPYFDTKSDWFQIEYVKGKKGWVSATYAKLVE
jgi:uncharacterized protein YgiM (DUF1202 family)